MAEKSSEFLNAKFMTPRAVLVFPRLNEPDTKFKPEGEYSTKVRVSIEDFQKIKVDGDTRPIIEVLEALLDEQRSRSVADLKIKVKELKAAKKAAKAKEVEEAIAAIELLPVIKEEVDDESGEPTGNYIFNAKMKATGINKKTKKPWKRAPHIFDSKGVKLAKPPSIWGGSEGKVAVEAFPYYTPKDNQVGIAFKLEAVQVLKLVSGGGRSAADYGFGAEDDGYEGDAETARAEAAPGDAASGDDDF